MRHIKWIYNLPSCRFSLNSGSAVAGLDFPAVFASTVTFNVGENNGATKQVTLSIINDNFVENDEDFQVGLVTNDNVVFPATATVLIIDDDGEFSNIFLLS